MDRTEVEAVARAFGEALTAAEGYLVRSSGCAGLTYSQSESATFRTIFGACRSLRPKAPKEDRDA